jgi:uncharacterized protein YjiS (DUF1127 family)
MQLAHARTSEATLIHERIDPYVAVHQDQGTPRHTDAALDPGLLDWIDTMTAPVSKSQLAYELPKLSYVDASWEEHNRRAAVQDEPSRGFADWLAGLVKAFRAWREREVAVSELSMMDDRELADIGINRSDVQRVFSADFQREMKSRGI